MVKSGARVLDATASNRSMWRRKNSRHVLWIDIEPELQRAPDMVLDCTATGFDAKRFHTIFFDPPPWWGDTPGGHHFSCRNDAERRVLEKRYGMPKRGGAYYGGDKFRTKRELLGFLHKSQREFSRILMDDGVLWLKWSEVKLSLDRILPFFRNWDEMMRIKVSKHVVHLSDAQNYWVMLMKKDGVHQAEL